MKTPLILIILLSALVSSSCTENLPQFLGDEKLKQSFMQAIKPVIDAKCDGDSIVFRLDTLTKFEWDKVYFAYSYSGDARINSRMGIVWKPISVWGNDKFIMNAYDNLFVFVKDSLVVSNVGFKPPFDEDFSFKTIADLEGFYIPQNAILSFRKRCYGSQRGYQNILRAITIPR